MREPSDRTLRRTRRGALLRDGRRRAGRRRSVGAATQRRARRSPTSTLVIDNSFVDRARPTRSASSTRPSLDRRQGRLRHARDVQGRPARRRCRGWRRRSRRRTARSCSPSSCATGVVFSDGTPLTSADVVFSFRRLINLKSSGSFLLAGRQGLGARSVRRSCCARPTPNPALTRIVANPALGIVNSKVGQGARRHRRRGRRQDATRPRSSSTTTRRAAGRTRIKQFSHRPADRPRRPTRSSGARSRSSRRVVMRNMTAPTQLLNVQRGANEIALDLSSQQASTLQRQPSSRCTSTRRRTCSTST